MALIKQPDKDFYRMYDGFQGLQVGPGTIDDPDFYASQEYAKSKIKDLYIGSLASFVYAGFQFDHNPLALVLSHVSQYNVALAINVNYLPIRIRLAVLKYVLESNKNRIRDRQPILIDYQALKRAVPPVKGATRMYKLPLIGVREVYPLLEWEDAAKTSPTRWSQHYKKFVK